MRCVVICQLYDHLDICFAKNNFWQQSGEVENMVCGTSNFQSNRLWSGIATEFDIHWFPLHNEFSYQHPATMSRFLCTKIIYVKIFSDYVHAFQSE